MAGLKEKDIERILVQEVRKLGGKALKFESPGNAGVPDRIVIFPHQQPIFVELKTDSGRLTALQNVQIGELRRLGQRVEVVRGMDGLSRFFLTCGYRQTSRELDVRFDL